MSLCYYSKPMFTSIPNNQYKTEISCLQCHIFKQRIEVLMLHDQKGTSVNQKRARTDNNNYKTKRLKLQNGPRQ